MAYKGPKEITGPSSSTDNAISRFDATSGDILQDSSVLISDANAVSGITQLDVDNIQINGNTLSSIDTDGNVIIAPNGAGVVSITDSAIVPSGDRAESLGSTTNSWDNLYTDAVSFDDGTNSLSVYEEGTWTPQLEFGGATTGIAYATQNGHYTRIGRMVYIRFAIILSSKGTATGDATITGLPVTSFGFGTPFCICRQQNITFLTGKTSIFGNIGSTSTTIDLQMAGDNTITADLTDTEFANNTLLIAEGFYFA